MAKFDEQLNRMEYLMGYHTSVNEGRTNVEYYTEGADGNIYGIIKEGTKYYIKLGKKGKEKLSENYSYINGFNCKKENEYNSYNEATKQLELKLISLNEAYGCHKDISTVDFDRNSKMLSTLTEDARNELDRLKQIMENSANIGIKDNIGNHGDAESKGVSKGNETEKNNKPFGEKTEAKLEQDLKIKVADSKNANKNYIDVSKTVDKNLTSDKISQAPSKAEKFTDAHQDLDGESVVDKHVNGGEAVMVNEDDERLMDLLNNNDSTEDGDNEDINLNDFSDEDTFIGDDKNVPYGSPEIGSDVVGIDDEDDMDSLMENFELLLKGKIGCEDNCDADKTQTKETEEALKGKHGTLPQQTWEKLSEAQKKKINTIVEGVCDKIFGKQKKDAESQLKETIDNIVTEELKQLGVWGMHPKFGKEPMTTPSNKEVTSQNIGHDWDDNSVKTSERYGKHVGKSDPFEEVVNILTDSVMNQIKESISLKKKTFENKTFLKVGNNNQNQQSAMDFEQSQQMIAPFDNQQAQGVDNSMMDMNGQQGGMSLDDMPQDDSKSEFDSGFDAGVEADEDEDPKKFIQQLTGKLSQSLNSYNKENNDDEELSKYVGKMIVKAAAKGLSDKGKKDLIKSINTTKSESDMDDDESKDELDEEIFTKKEIKNIMESFNSDLELKNKIKRIPKKQNTVYSIFSGKQFNGEI